jgi:kynureninase
MLDLRSHFFRFLAADPDRLHFAAHSHGAWPDVTRKAQLRCWDDAARLLDDKWETILGPLLDRVRAELARHLGLPDPRTLAFAPNTHEFLLRILSALPERPKLLTTDGEFHSFHRQVARLEEDGLVEVERVPVEPFASFAERFAACARAGFDIVWLSQVFFNSGFAVTDEEVAVIAAGSGEALVAVDGYHGAFARPTDLSQVAERVFYMSGGYKYLMAGEGCCFLHCPSGFAPRPRDTGWFAAFGDLTRAQEGRVPYPEDGWRFMGATFDPSGLYRLDAVLEWLRDEELSAEAIHAHALALQERFAAGLARTPLAGWLERLVVPIDEPRRGNFLTVELPDAGDWQRRLAAARIVTDHRAGRLRLGFGLYHAAEDVDRLLDRLAAIASA